MISTIIPCYNAIDTLERAVNSCLIQAEINEIIIVDDASTDGFFALATNLSTQSDKIKVHRLAQNSGPAAARNFGILNSQQSILSFLDADDEYLPNGLHLGYDALSNHPQLAAIKLSCVFVGCPLIYSTHPSFTETCTILSNTFAGNLMIRREVLFALGLFPQNPIFRKHGGEDGVLMLALSDLFLVGNVKQEKPCVNIHFHSNSHSQIFFDVCIERSNNTHFIEKKMMFGITAWIVLMRLNEVLGALNRS